MRIIAAGILLLPLLAVPAHAAGPQARIVARTDLDGNEHLTRVVSGGKRSAFAFGHRDGDLYEVPLAYRWDGRKWRKAAFPGKARGEVSDAAAVGKRTWAVTLTGPYAPSGNGSGAKTVSTLHRWTGKRWAVVRSWPGAAIYEMSVTGPKDLWLFGSVRDNSFYRAAWHFDGRKWRRTTVPIGVRSVAARSAKDIWAVGRDDRGVAAAARFDGRRWKKVPFGAALPATPQLEPPAGGWREAYASGVVLGRGGAVTVTANLTGDQTHLTRMLTWTGTGWRAEEPAAAKDWDLTAPTPDGRGGLWTIGSWRNDLVGDNDPAHDRSALFHRSASGAWTTVPLSQPDLATALAIVPGTRTLFGAGTQTRTWDLDGVITRTPTP